MKKKLWILIENETSIDLIGGQIPKDTALIQQVYD